MGKSEFDKFKKGMAGGGRSLGDALGLGGSSVNMKDQKVVETPTGKTTDPSKKQVSHYIDKSLAIKLNMLKAVSGKSMSELYEEAVMDLLAKHSDLL